MPDYTVAVPSGNQKREHSYMHQSGFRTKHTRAFNASLASGVTLSLAGRACVGYMERS